MTHSGVIVMTGGGSGLGEHAARRMVKDGRDLVLMMRGAGASRFGRAIRADLSEMSSVQRFCAQVLALTPERKIDALVLNAGGSFRLEKTGDNFEMNFACNHLGHYLMARLLLPALADKARIVITTSATHDPETGAAIPAPRHAQAKRLAFPETDPDLDANPGIATGRAYAAAKLACLLTAQALARRSDLRARAIQVIAYSPGPTPGTGLVRSRGGVLNFLWRWILPAAARLSAKMNTPRAAGDALADIALGLSDPPADRVYALLDGGELTFPEPSALARDDRAIKAMWEDSAALLGLESDWRS